MMQNYETHPLRSLCLYFDNLYGKLLNGLILLISTFTPVDDDDRSGDR